MHVLIVSYYFPPYNTIGSIRVGKFARYLIELGHRVHVVTADKPALEQNDASLPVEIDAELVQYTRWTDVNWPPRAVVGAIRQVRDRRSGRTRNTVVSPTLEAVPGPLRRLAKLYISLTNVPDAFFGWSGPAYAAARTVVTKYDVDMILASGPPFTSFMVASKVSGEFGIPWVADLRDLWADKEPYPFVPARRPFDRWQQRHILGTASGLATVSPPLAETLRNDGLSAPVEVIYNGFDPADLPPQVQPATTGPLLVRYTGSLYGDPDPLFRAVALLPDWCREVRLEFLLRGHAPTLMQAATRRGVSECVHILDPLPYSESLAFQAAADVLLLVQNEGARWRGIVSGKIFEYLGARRPILALSGTDSVVDQILTETRAGIACRDPGVIAAWLKEKMLLKRAGGIEPIDAADAERYTRLAQTQRLADFMCRFIEPS